MPTTQPRSSGLDTMTSLVSLSRFVDISSNDNITLFKFNADFQSVMSAYFCMYKVYVTLWYALGRVDSGEPLCGVYGVELGSG